MGQYIGQSVKRVEDQRFITGKGQYTDDITLPGMTFATFIRSPLAHANIKKIDLSAAKNAPGYVASYVGGDIPEAIAGVPCGWQVDFKNGDTMKEPPHPLLARTKALHVGDGVAVVIAETQAQAKDAAAMVEVEYEELPAVTDISEALKDGAPQLHDGVPNNKIFDWELGSGLDAVDSALASASHVTKLDIVNQRLIPNAIEPRCAIGDYDDSRDYHTLYTSSQNPHVIRLLMSAFVLGLPEHKVRVVAPDVGGGFGSKIFHYAEEALMVWVAKQIKRPVKWTAERTESFLSDGQGRDHKTKAQMGFDSDGKMVALKVETDANLGAYLSTFSTAVPTYLHGTLMQGLYTTPAVHITVNAGVTNTAAVDAYRGAGRPEATYVIERLVETAAAEMGVDPAELRLKNFIPPFDGSDAEPGYQTQVALQYDSGNYEGVLNRLLEMSDYENLKKERETARANGKLMGIGFSTYIEACGIAPSAVVGSLGARAGLFEAANIRVEPTGSVTLFTGSHSHGQGHETTFAQLIADDLGIPLENVEVVHGDTGKVPFGMGTYGSRSLAVGGSAIVKSLEKIKEKGTKIAAHLLEASAEDLDFADGKWTVKGTDKSVAFGDVSLTAYVPHNYPEGLEPGLDETSFYDPVNFTYPFGAHMAVVEVDPDTGKVDLKRFIACDDVGNVVNPMIVDGQIHGGVAQGIGQALLEGAVYDESGQLNTASYLDYALPRADDLPSFELDRTVTPCLHNPLGAKGCGEAGTIGSTPAVVNAVVDALRPMGVTDLEMPLSPQRVWAAMQQAK
jgi:carbon-monoxide dehydrogenase large subunit